MERRSTPLSLMLGLRVKIARARRKLRTNGPNSLGFLIGENQNWRFRHRRSLGESRKSSPTSRETSLSFRPERRWQPDRDCPWCPGKYQTHGTHHDSGSAGFETIHPSGGAAARPKPLNLPVRPPAPFGFGASNIQSVVALAACGS